MAARLAVCPSAGHLPWRLTARNGEIVASWAAYPTTAVATEGPEAVERAAATAEVVQVDK